MAAGFPSQTTVLLSEPESGPRNGMGSGVGTGPLGDGTITTCVSVAMMSSPLLASGLDTRTD
jgi:hypothetical protein